MQAARHAVNATRAQRATQPVTLAPILQHAVDAQDLAALLFGDVDDETMAWLPYTAPPLADPTPMTAQYGSICPALADLFAQVAQHGATQCYIIVYATQPPVSPPPAKRRAPRRKAPAAEEPAAPVSAPPTPNENLFVMMDNAPMFDDARHSPWTPAVGPPVADDREVDLGGGMVVHVEQCVAS